MKKIKTSEIIVIVIIISILILILLPALEPSKDATRALSILEGNSSSASEANKDFNKVCKWLEQQKFKVVNRDTQSVDYKGKYKKAELSRVSVLVYHNRPYVQIFLSREMEYENHPDFLELYSKLKKMIKRDNQETAGDGVPPPQS